MPAGSAQEPAVFLHPGPTPHYLCTSLRWPPWRRGTYPGSRDPPQAAQQRNETRPGGQGSAGGRSHEPSRCSPSQPQSRLDPLVWSAFLGAAEPEYQIQPGRRCPCEVWNATMSQHADPLRRKHHARTGCQPARLALLTDAVFAIATTLLIIESKIPERHHAPERAALSALVRLTPKLVVLFHRLFRHGHLLGGAPPHLALSAPLRRPADLAADDALRPPPPPGARVRRGPAAAGAGARGGPGYCAGAAVHCSL